MRHIILATLSIAALLYGYRLTMAQEPEQTFGLTCTITGQEVVCRGTLSDVPTSTPIPSTSTATHVPPSPTQTATPTIPPTSTPLAATPTPTIAAPPTLTPTAVTGYTVENLIADTTGTNDGTLCAPANSFNWGQRGHGLTGEGPEGDQLTGWWTAQWVSCGASSSGVTIQFQGWRMYGWTGSGWVTFSGNYNNWCASTNPATTGSYGSCAMAAGGYVMPTGQRALHGATNRVPDQNVQCVVVTYQARTVGAVIMNAGADHIAGGSILGDLFISKLKRIGADWTHIGGSSCTANRLRTTPPPGF